MIRHVFVMTVAGLFCAGALAAGYYRVPTTPEFEEAAKFEVSYATFSEADGRYVLSFSLPADLTGGKSERVEFRGEAVEADGAVRLTNELGRAKCRRQSSEVSCEIRYENKFVSDEELSAYLENKYRDRADFFTKRLGVALGFQNDPFGVLVIQQIRSEEDVAIDVKKMLDGKTVFCREDRNVGSAAYLPSRVRVSTVGDELSVKIEIAHLTCKKEGAAFRWAPRLPLDPIPGKASDGSPTQMYLRNVELLVANTTFQSIRVVPVANVAVQELTVAFSASELLRQREEGRDRIFLEFMQRSIAEVVYNGERTHLGWRTGGAYSILFNLNRAGTSYQVRGLTVSGQ